jgi:hypothetical protein
MEEFPDAERIRQVVELGRRSVTDSETAALLAELSRGPFPERRLALIACYGSRDGAAVLRAVGDPSRWIRGYAIGAVAALCDDAQAAAALEALPVGRRRGLARRLVRWGRRVVVDRVVSSDGRGDREVRELMPYATEATARALVNRMEEASGIEWSRLAGHHPELVADALLGRIRAGGTPDARLVWLVNEVTPRLAKRHSTRVLDLQQALAAAGVPLGQLHLDRLLPQHAVAVADLVLASEDRPHLHLRTATDRLDGRRLAGLAHRLPRMRGVIVSRFRHLAPEVRLVVYEATGMAWRTDDGTLALDIVRWLPGPARAEEARRHLGLPALATKPVRRLPYAALLGWDQAQAELAAELSSPDPDLRLVAVSALVGSVRYQRDRTAELIDYLRRRRYEQDPIRAAFVTGISQLPPGTWRDDDLPGLSELVRHALDAADCSEATVAGLVHLAARLYQRHPEWAAETLANIARERGRLAARGLANWVTSAQLPHLLAKLLPVLKVWRTRNRDAQILEVAEGLGRRVRAAPELGELLERVVLATRRSWEATRGLTLLRKHQPVRFASVAVRLLDQDRSAILLTPVAGYVSERRQDLLSSYLAPQQYSGRYTAGAAPVVVAFPRPPIGWTAAQEAKYAAALARLTRRDPTRDTPTIHWAIGGLARLHLEPPTRLIEMTRAPHVAVRDAAMRQLARVDRADLALPVLFEALGDERARVAIYALRRLVLDVPPAEAIALLARAPMDQVTVAKEVVRLLGDIPVRESLDELLRLEAGDLHRDVRVALLRGLWGHADQPEAWAVLEAAAGSSDPALARSLVRIPAGDLGREAQRRLVAVLARLADHPDPAVRIEVAARCLILPLADPDGLLLSALSRHLASRFPDERAAAAAGVIALASPDDSARMAGLVRDLLPDRRASHDLAAALSAAVPAAPARLTPVAVSVLAELDRDPLTASLAFAIAVRALPWSELGARLAGWSAAGALDGDLLGEAVGMLTRPAASGRPLDFVALAALERELANTADPRLRRLGLAILSGLAASPGGWSAERLAWLDAYRADPSALVAGPAQFTFPPDD